MLSPAIQKGLIDLWSDDRVPPGGKWHDEIQKAISESRKAVLLVSPSFLASRFITQRELDPLLKLAAKQHLKVFWICLTACLFGETDLGVYQAAHDVSQPLDTLSKPKRQTVLREICTKLLQL